MTREQIDARLKELGSDSVVLIMSDGPHPAHYMDCDESDDVQGYLWLDETLPDDDYNGRTVWWPNDEILEIHGSNENAIHAG